MHETDGAERMNDDTKQVDDVQVLRGLLMMRRDTMEIQLLAQIEAEHQRLQDRMSHFPERLWLSAKTDSGRPTEYVRGDIVEGIRQQRRDAQAIVDKAITWRQSFGGFREGHEDLGHVATEEAEDSLMDAVLAEEHKREADEAAMEPEPDAPMHKGLRAYPDRDAGKR